MDLVELLALHASQRKRPKKIGKLPKALPPRGIERDYIKFLRGVVTLVRTAYRRPLEQIALLLTHQDAAPVSPPMRFRRETETRFVTELHPSEVMTGRTLTMSHLDSADQVKRFLDQAKDEMRKMVTTVPMERFLHTQAERTGEWAHQQFSKQARAAIGVDIFSPNPLLRKRVEGFVTGNVERIKNLTEDTSQRISALVLQAVQDGRSYDRLAADIGNAFDVSESRATLIARDQTGKLYGQINADQQKAAGIDKFVWRTSNDDRVRDEHADLEGEVFSYDDPPDEGLPGEAVNCRCHAEPYFEDLLK